MDARNLITGVLLGLSLAAGSEAQTTTRTTTVYRTNPFYSMPGFVLPVPRPISVEELRRQQRPIMIGQQIAQITQQLAALQADVVAIHQAIAALAAQQGVAPAPSPAPAPIPAPSPTPTPSPVIPPAPAPPSPIPAPTPDPDPDPDPAPSVIVTGPATPTVFGPAPGPSPSPSPTPPAPTLPGPSEPDDTLRDSLNAAVSETDDSLSRSVWALLQSRCAKCHSSGTSEGNFELFAADGTSKLPLSLAKVLLLDQVLYNNFMPKSPVTKLNAAEYGMIRGWADRFSEAIRTQLVTPAAYH